MRRYACWIPELGEAEKNAVEIEAWRDWVAAEERVRMLDLAEGEIIEEPGVVVCVRDPSNLRVTAWRVYGELTPTYHSDREAVPPEAAQAEGTT